MVTNYYRVFDYQRGTHFAVGYNATSMEELIENFQGLMSDDQQKQFFEYVDTSYFYEVDNDEFVSEMILFRQYFTK
mgnify:CR=1 FL=1